ncbi:MAG: hypothetical protein AB7U29_03845 [Desulfobulbus sp.]
MSKTWIRGTWEKSTLHRRVLAIIGCVVICGLTTVGVVQAKAVEQNSEVAATARKLQLEGARLQLQGNLEEAVKKYRESNALQPNQRLDGLIKQLEPKIDGLVKSQTANFILMKGVGRKILFRMGDAGNRSRISSLK